jgi:FkbM family methyltransferase
MAADKEIADYVLQRFASNRSLNGLDTGILVEVGAYHPTTISVSAHFRILNWKIVAIEPNPIFCEEFRKQNVPILEYAACADDKGSTTFKVSPNPLCCSALEIRYMGWWPENEYKTIMVEALTLNTILERHHPEVSKIDVLLVDTEGWEVDVLRGIDLQKFSVKVVVVENMSFLPKIDSRAFVWSYLEANGYTKEHQFDQDEIWVKNNQEKQNEQAAAKPILAQPPGDQ